MFIVVLLPVLSPYYIRTLCFMWALKYCISCVALKNSPRSSLLAGAIYSICELASFDVGIFSYFLFMFGSLNDHIKEFIFLFSKQC